MTSPVNSTSLAGQLVNQANAGGPAGGKMGKNEFLKLLTTQLRYQDPLDPMDGKDMAADLAQFSGLEQLLNINEQLEAQQGQYDALALTVANGQAMNTIGKTVMVAGDKVLLAKDANGDMVGSVTADITTQGNATLKLYDKSGKEVGSRSLGYLGTGQQTFDIGAAAAKVGVEGAYAYRITVVDAASGKDVPQKTYTVGKIDGISYGEDGKAALTMGPLTIEFAAIVRILST
ncbi:MAG: hypothetical protein IT361_00165 [Gemmatimonadaceae bacterium]|nr:hypothetical protein [Gemmatimonadaceae bacterium]